MSPRQLLLPVLAGAALAVGCGADDDPAPAAAPTGPNAQYIGELGALCSTAKNERDLLDRPSPGKNEELATYLGQIIDIQGAFRERTRSLDPPRALAADQREALRIEGRLAETIAGYERAARGGERRFVKLVRALQKEANPQIDAINAVFERMDVGACRLDEIKEIGGR